MSDQSASGMARRAAASATYALKLEGDVADLQREVAELKAERERYADKKSWQYMAELILAADKAAAAKEAAEQRCAELKYALRVARPYMAEYSSPHAPQDIAIVDAALAASPQGSSPAGAGQQEAT